MQMSMRAAAQVEGTLVAMDSPNATEGRRKTACPTSPIGKGAPPAYAPAPPPAIRNVPTPSSRGALSSRLRGSVDGSSAPAWTLAARGAAGGAGAAGAGAGGGKGGGA